MGPTDLEDRRKLRKATGAESGHRREKAEGSPGDPRFGVEVDERDLQGLIGGNIEENPHKTKL